VSNRFLAIIAVIFLAVLLIRAEMRMTRIEEKLDDVVQTKDLIKYTAADVECLTKNIYYEAGIEGRTGKYAVAHVTINRVKVGRWGRNICKVVYSPSQFSWTLKKSLPTPNKNLWNESQEIAIEALEGARVRGLSHSLYYHADYIRQPKWADPEEHILTIGRHMFYNRAKNLGTSI